MATNLTDDLDLAPHDLQDLSSADAVSAFFGRLGYRTEVRIPQTSANLGITAEGTVRSIRRIELIANHEDLFQLYLCELRSVTVAHTRALARAFRHRAGNFLLVLTSDYETIDFVLLERYLPRARGEARTPRVPHAGIRPRSLTVERRKPRRLHLRVLRRLTWTESDALAQYFKILSAFTVAEWSGETFNNRALFSDYYLTTPFREHPVWQEDPLPAYRRLREICRNAASRLARRGVAQLRSDLLVPVLEALGFQLDDRRRPRGAELDGYPLLGPETKQPLALCLDYPWGRFLDGKDTAGLDADTAEINPGAHVVSLLERGPAPWVIVTNGKLWRLYARRAHSRATNYYEIDLEEILVHPGDVGESFRYFWLLFRRQAFEPREILRQGRRREESLADYLLAESEAYAQGLGERLKEKVFEQVFPTLAEGFLAAAPAPTLPAQEELDAVYRGTLTLLYRLLFLLYAEARDLLPVREVRGYWELSLARMREEVAAVAGPALSDVDERLARHYRDDAFTLYERLLRLFRVVDRGDVEVNVPPYDGGLFLSQPADDDASAEAEAARFLAAARLPDLSLARALDRLARDEDAKSHKLGAVDYRSLGVRQLGSIYEGLLEFRLRVAREEMAIVAGKKKGERLVALAEARREGFTIVREGRGEAAREKILPPGTAYLENDKGERRATGSYYTPDFVVEYIVARTLGPLIRDKLEALRPDLRRAERWHRKMTAMAEGKGEPREKYETGPAVDGKWHLLVDQVFDLKVLDPAMGSGHFLVEVVDFVTDKILDFLNAHRWNPVNAHLESVRATILGEMEEQGIAIDDKRLTPVNLLKRHVLKRCVYGVDVNPMAVELAKVSLWLDCFTLGAPLSFLDHHLRCGNSILGVEVNDVREALEGTGMEARSQLLLFGSRFAGLKLATAGMIAVGGMPDVTSDQIRESRCTYRSAANALEPFVRILDVYTGHWFLDPEADPDQKSARRRKPVEVRRAVVDLLKDPQVEELLNATSDEEAERALAAVKPADRRYLEAVGGEAGRRRFFHWDVEFPEVFYKPPPGREATVERLPEAGFDAVVGNPPWVRQEGLREMKPALAGLFPETYASEADVYVYLLTRGVQVLRRGGRFGMILQNKWFKAEYAATLRRFLNDELRPLEVVDFGHAPLFDADTFPCVLLLEKPEKADAAQADAGRVDFFDVDRKDLPGINLAAYGSERRCTVPRRRLRPEGWELLPEPVGDLMEKIRRSGVPLKDFVGASPLYGIKTGYNQAFLIDQTTRDRLVAEDPGCEDVIKPFVRGENVRRWHTPWGGEWLILLASSQNREWPWSAAKDEATAEDRFREKFPSLHGWMISKKRPLQRRNDQGEYWWELRSCDYYDNFCRPKIVYQEIQYHSRYSLAAEALYLNNKAFLIPSESDHLVAILNSALMWWYLERFIGHMKDEAYAMQGFKVEKLPIVPVLQDREDLAEASRRLVDLTTAEHSEGNRFRTWLTRETGIARISGRLESYWHLELADFIDALRSKRKANLSPAEQSRLREAFTESRARLRELRREICRLEIELHHGVFELYGLTREEIDLLRRTAPPRDPLLLAEEELALLEAEPR